MFEQLLEYYNSQVGNGDDEGEWAAAEALSQDVTWSAIQDKLITMDRFVYTFAAEELYDIDDLLRAIRRFVLEEAEDGQGHRINELYGRQHSDRQYKDLIELAKLIALHRRDRNYHRVLLCDNLYHQSEVTYYSLYTMPHSELCPVWNRTPQPAKKFDLIPYEDLMRELRETNRLRNFYNPAQPINPAITIGHPDSPYYLEFQELSGNLCGVITRPTYYALKAFVEVVSNEFDAGNSLDGCCYRGRVAVKYEAFRDLCGFLESLPRDQLDALNNTKINGSTFKAKVQSVIQGSCASLFSDDLSKMLFQFNPDIQFTNPRAMDIIARNRNGLPLRGKVLKTEAEDRNYLENMCKVILNTEFEVTIGTKVSSIDGEQSNRVPSHVAEMFEICKLGLEGGMNPSEARYKAIETAARCYRNPHNSFLFFMNTRDPKTHNFYGMVINQNFADTIKNNDRVDNHQYYLRGLPVM